MVSLDSGTMFTQILGIIFAYIIPLIVIVFAVFGVKAYVSIKKIEKTLDEIKAHIERSR